MRREHPSGVVGEQHRSCGGRRSRSRRRAARRRGATVGLAVEQPPPEAGRGLAHDEPVHPRRAGRRLPPGARRCRTAGGRRIVRRSSAGVATLGSDDQGTELVADVGVGLGRATRPRGGRRSQDVSSITEQRTQLDEWTRPDVADHLGRGDRAEVPARRAGHGPWSSRTGTRRRTGRRRRSCRSPCRPAPPARASARRGVTMTQPSAPDGDRRELALVAQRRDGVVERVELVERQQLVVVAEQQVDVGPGRGRGSRRGAGRRRTSPTASATPCRSLAWATSAACRNAALASSRSNR